MKNIIKTFKKCAIAVSVSSVLVAQSFAATPPANMAQQSKALAAKLFSPSNITPIAEDDLEGRIVHRENQIAFSFESEIMEQTMIVEINLPYAYFDPENNTSFPVSYMYDSTLQFQMVASDNFRGSFGGAYMPEMITVGFDAGDYDDECNRITNLSFAEIPNDENCGAVGGKADRTIAFLRDELKPLINSLFPIDETQESLAGHSMGGLFSLYTLFTAPDLFDKYVAISPSLYWADEAMFDMEQTFADSREVLGKEVYISAMMDETGGAFQSFGLPSWWDDSLNERGVNYVFRVGRQLKRHFPEAAIRLQAFPGEDHNSGAGVAFHEGNQFVFTGK